MKKFMVIMALIAVFGTVQGYAFSPGDSAGPRSGLHLNSGLVASTDYDNLNSAIAAIGSTNATLLVTAPLNVLSSLTIPVNVRVEMKAGGSFVYAPEASGTVTLTITGPLSASPGVAIFSGANLAPVINLATTPNVYAAWGTFTTSGTSPVNLNQIINFGTTSLVNGSQVVTFAVGSTYTSSVSFATTATVSPTANAIGVTQTSGSSVTFTGTGTNKFNYISVGK